MRYAPRVIRRLRWDKGWSLSELAARSGVSFDTMKKVEDNRTNPYPKTAKRIADALGVLPSDILVDEDDEENKDMIGIEIGFDNSKPMGAVGRAI